MSQSLANGAAPSNFQCLGAELLEALVKNRPSPAAQKALWMAGMNWVADGGVIPMHLYLRLPSTPAKVAQATRDFWLSEAANLIDAPSVYKKAAALHVELNTFVTRGPWRSWESLRSPPEDASELRKRLFYAMKFGKGKIIEERQIHRILS